MKPILLIAFLTLGPVLAEHVSVAPSDLDPGLAPAITVAQHASAGAPTATPVGERTLPCGR